MVIPVHNYTVREKTVVEILKNYKGELKSFLNVGFHNWEDPRRHWWIKICKENGIQWDIMEVYKPNVEDAVKKGCPSERIILGNILDTHSYLNYDCILFWHGPEHIKKDVFLEKLSTIESKANKLIIFGMPLGHEPQDAAYGNPFERHESDWFEKDWKDLGYTVIPIHDHQAYPHMTAYKQIS